MLANIRQISILNKIFNVRGTEWPRIIFAWAITFLYRVGFVIGWTMIVALFVTKYGIASLPYLFVINAIFSILGSILYSTFLDRFKKDFLMIVTLFLACFILFSAFYFAYNDPILFFALLIVAEAVFLGQFRIILHGFTEEMFTPIQSERTFPLIESSETIGGIIAGLIVVFIASAIDPASFVLIWITFLLLIVPLIFLCEMMNKKVKSLGNSGVEVETSSFFTKLKNELSNTSHMSYIKGIFLIVFFQWLLFNLLEFQYTKAVYHNVSDVILDAGGGFEHSFVHDLGQLFIIFSGSALVVQLFVGSRLMNSLGVMGSMLLHPIVTLLSLFGLTSSFDFRNAVLAKNNFTITTTIHTNAYHSSYYAINEKLREHVREFLDGIIRPIGAVFGVAVLIFLQKVFVGEDLIFYVNISMVVTALILFYITFLQQYKYTQVALGDLEKSNSKHVRFNAIDILSQRGHRFSISILSNILLDQSEPTSIKIKVLKAFSEIQDINVISKIVKCLDSKNAVIRRNVVITLLSYKAVTRESSTHLVLEHELIDALEKAYKNETHDDIRAKILTLLSRISTVTTFEFLLHSLRKTKGALKADIISALGNYNDPAVVDYIRPYLESSDLKHRIAAIIALGRFEDFKAESLDLIKSLLNSDDLKMVESGLFALGELRVKSKKKLCFKYLKSKNTGFKLHSAVALAKMGYQESIPVLIDFLFHSNKFLAKKAKSLLENVDVLISKNLDRIVKQLVIYEVDKIVSSEKNVSMKGLSKKKLETLKWLYSLVDEYDEIESIDNLLKI